MLFTLDDDGGDGDGDGGGSSSSVNEKHSRQHERRRQFQDVTLLVFRSFFLIANVPTSGRTMLNSFETTSPTPSK